MLSKEQQSELITAYVDLIREAVVAYNNYPPLNHRQTAYQYYADEIKELETILNMDWEAIIDAY